MHLRLLAALLFCASLLNAQAPPGVALQWDPHHPDDKTAAIWLAYLMFRCSYRLDHKVPLPQSGEIVPSFSEEVHARENAAQVYRELKAKDKNLRDGYWETVSVVAQKGFIKPYVWTHLRRPAWPPSDKPANLAAFEQWARSALANHTAVTYGSLTVQK